MRTSLYRGAAATLSAWTLSCAMGDGTGARSAALAGNPGEEMVTIQLVDAMISPTRLDGRAWDSATPLSDTADARERMVNAMNHASNAKSAYDAASAVLDHLGDAPGRPDVGGTASVDPGDGKVESRSLEGAKDTLHPRFTATWTHVPLTRWTKMKMYFVDRDRVGGDIGAVVLSPLDLAAALKERGAVHHLRVDDQTNGQVLFVGFSVKAE